MNKQVIVIAGPNGSGKSTCAKHLLHEFLQIHEYVNADLISLELFGNYDYVNTVSSSKIMLKRIHKLALKKRNFAFETTLAPRSLASWLEDLTKRNYEFILHFIWLQSPELAVERVSTRVKVGGHNVPKNTIYRRYWMGIKNFFNLYQPLAKIWKVYDNSTLQPPKCIAVGHYDNNINVMEPELWHKFRRMKYESSPRKSNR